MKYYAVKFSMQTKEFGEIKLPTPYVYEAENIPQLVEDLEPVCEYSGTEIVSIRPARRDEIYSYLRGEVCEGDEIVDDYDLTDYDQFWEQMIAELDE